MIARMHATKLLWVHELRLHVHALMQHTNYFDFGSRLFSVVNDVASDRELSITSFNEVALKTCIRTFGQHMKCLVKTQHVESALFSIPSALCECGNSAQVLLGFLRQ